MRGEWRAYPPGPQPQALPPPLCAKPPYHNRFMYPKAHPHDVEWDQAQQWLKYETVVREIANWERLAERYRAWQSLNIRAHITIELVLRNRVEDNSWKGIVLSHLYPYNNNDPSEGAVETYTFVKRSGNSIPSGILNAARTNYLGQVDETGRNGNIL